MAAKSSSVLWKDTTAITKEVSKEGQIPHTVTGWACLYCNVEVWNRDASRLALHLSGDAVLRDASNGFSGIGICPRVPSDVADRAKIEMAAKTAKKARKSSLSAAGNVMASEEGDLRAEKMQATLPQLNNKDAKRIKADNSLSDLFDGQGWAHNIVNGNLIQTAVKDIVAAGPDYKMPSATTLSGTILERQCAWSI